MSALDPAFLMNQKSQNESPISQPLQLFLYIAFTNIPSFFRNTGIEIGGKLSEAYFTSKIKVKSSITDSIIDDFFDFFFKCIFHLLEFLLPDRFCIMFTFYHSNVCNFMFNKINSTRKRNFQIICMHRLKKITKNLNFH